MKKTLSVTALLVAALLALTACGGGTGDSGDSGSTQPAAESSDEFNDADVTFAQNMIPHHEQAVQMAQMAEEQADSAQVTMLAAKIEAAQAPEINQLQGWLKAWGAEGSTGSMDHGDMGHGDTDSSMAGMMTEDDMTTLMDASGAQWDETFLTMMIEHHQGAVGMALTEVENGENPDAIAMAKRIIATQQAEIDQMKQMLNH